MNDLTQDHAYQGLLTQISNVYEQGRQKVFQYANDVLLETKWLIGQHIVEFEQQGKIKATYGKYLLNSLSKDLSLKYGKGFSRSNVVYMRLLYVHYPISEKPSHQLSWSHYVELLKIADLLERSFYEKQAIKEKWSVPELKRQKKTALYLRLAAGKDKEGILKLAQEGQQIASPEDLMREPYIFEFLKIPEPYHISEKDLETRLIDNLQPFLLELGKGFAYVGRQYRITINNEHYYVDLVFYHRYLKCYVLIDLKITELRHQDIGQMNMYLGYFAHEENVEGDNPPIGIILTKDKDELMVEYATYGMNSQLLVAKYQLYLPNAAELRKLILEVEE